MLRIQNLEMKSAPRPTIYSGPLGWGWCRLQELAELLNRVVFADYDPRTPAQIWEGYFGLSKDRGMACGRGTLAYWSGSPVSRHRATSGIPLAPESILVPAGWVADVIDHALRGVWAISTREYLGGANSVWLHITAHYTDGRAEDLDADVQVSIF